MTNQSSLPQRNELTDEIWSLSEAVYGVKPRWYQFDNMSIADMQNEICMLNRSLSVIESEEKEMERMDAEENEATIRNVMNVCNCDRSTALKYLDDANQVSE